MNDIENGSCSLRTITISADCWGPVHTGRLPVFEACDGSEAFMEMGKRRFDMVLSDYHMPRMNGLAFLDISTHLWPGTPVILASCDPELTESPGKPDVQPGLRVLG